MLPTDLVLLFIVLLLLAWQFIREIRFQSIISSNNKAHSEEIAAMQERFLKRQAELEGMAFIDQKERAAWLDASITRFQKTVSQQPEETVSEYEIEAREEEDAALTIGSRLTLRDQMKYAIPQRRDIDG